MADNSQYAFGLDWYEDNRVNSWAALVQWDKQVAFAYFRLGIGLHPDNLTLLNECHNNTLWDLGGYYELWLPTVPKDRQLEMLKGQLAKCPWLTLPVSLAFEPQAYRDAKGNVIRGWPSVGDLKYIAGKLIETGYRVNIYTNLSGLDIIKASRLVDMTTADWWIARSYAFPLWSTEMDIDATLTYLQTKYGIQREHVQFFQTILDHGNSPIGGGQDFDRAVSWDFGNPPSPPPPEPPPAPAPILDVTVISNDAKLESAILNGENVTDRTVLHVKPISPSGPPQGGPGIYRILNDWEAPEKYYGGKSRTAAKDWRGNPMTPETIKFSGGRTPTKLSAAGAQFVSELNTPHGTFGYVTRTAAGWSNRGEEWPEKVEQLTFCDNIVDVVRIEGKRAYIRPWRGEKDDPCVIHRWVNVDDHNRLYGPQNPGGDGIGFIVLDYLDGIWLPLDRLAKVNA